MDRPLTQNIKPGQGPVSLRDYESNGGYQALRKALQEYSPQDVQKTVKDADLRGRGGAGFPAGLKWSFVPMGEDAPQPKYFVINADEMEPGTFKDRLLMEGDPHLLIEGTILGSYAIGASVAYIFLRWEYREAAQIIEKAIEEAREAGFLGENIQGSGYNLEMHLHISAGRYICGEETALLNALEGKVATPRAKPPFPQASGLFGKPTCVNNVETICNVPHIVTNGPEWFKNLGKTEEAGTKLYGVSGKVKNPGCWELPIGVTLREILEEHAGGMQDGLKFRGCLPGGASTDFLVEEHLDMPMDYKHVQDAGSRLGTGTMIILDDQTCPVGMVENLIHFFAQESCGWCTPCREGLPWTEKVLEAILAGDGKPFDMRRLEMHAKLLGPGNTFCALAPGAVEPLQSALKYFREDFEKYFKDKQLEKKSA